MGLVAFLLAAAVLFVVFTVRDHRRAVRSRRAMLDACVPLFEGANVEVRRDGYPRLAGRSDSLALRVSLVPDTFVPKRLPQLWLIVSLPARLAVPRLAVTMRPRGEDIVSLGPTMRVFLPTPDWLPQDCTVRADGEQASEALVACRQGLAAAFQDARLKEIAFDPNGLRLVYQADQGRRGAHLLLRQARFDRPVPLDTLARLRNVLVELERAARGLEERRAA